MTGERLAVGAPFFNRWMLPIGDPADADGHRPAARVAQVDGLQPRLPVEVAGRRLRRHRDGALGLGMRVWASGICFALCALVMTTIVQEFVRRSVRRDATGSDIFTALVGLVGRSKRRYGGYIVHVGIVLIFLGFAGEGFKKEQQALLKPGEEVTVGYFTVRRTRYG